ncbi:unnamed protein product [Triticum turgidum subsp. durum]|uniref:F-box domain-containing protein n=1 Tax=Triticum turgidum subsp. durum TaxID=4567 RepID=A0A9R1PVV8_TRITD|nr:unnamed protein product [Triticum turgidum subsp. durum]
MDDVLPIVISFLPAHEAVRTCVLSPRWRHFWTSAPGLRITAVGDFGSADKFNQFVDRLLFLRRHSDCPLESCEFDLDDREFGFNSISSFQHVYRWSLQSALDCNVRVLRCSFTDTNPNFRMLPEQLSEYPEPLLSQHLTRLELHCIRCALDFSGCPVLVDLKMEQCVTHAAEMLSPSLRQLSMVCCELSMWHRTQVTLPNLVRLELINCAGRLPLLESLPSLETAVVDLGEFSEDRCPVSGCLDDDPCFGCHFHFEFIAQRGSSYFFQGLSRAKHLELLASYNDAVCMLATPLFCLLMLYQEPYHQLTCMYPVYALKLSYLFPYQKLSTNIIIQSILVQSHSLSSIYVVTRNWFRNPLMI